jgi:hypothetical protein
MTLQTAPDGPHAGWGPIRSPIDLGGGLFLIFLGFLGIAGGYDLPFGTLSGIGSGLLPRTVSLLVGTFGVLLVIQSFLAHGERLEKWHLRGPVFVLGAVIVFALVIRGSTLTIGGILGIPIIASFKIPSLGLIVAGPLAMLVSGLATSETRFGESAIFAAVMTLLSGLLFKDALGLPIPFDPMGLVPSFINDAHESLKHGVLNVFAAIKQLFGG